MTISPSTTEPSGIWARKTVVQLGKVAIERPRVATLDEDVGCRRERRSRGTRPIWAHRGTLPVGSSSASFASIGSIGGAMAKVVGERIEPFDEIGRRSTPRQARSSRAMSRGRRARWSEPVDRTITARGRDRRRAASRLCRHGEGPNLRFRLCVGERTRALRRRRERWPPFRCPPGST